MAAAGRLGRHGNRDATLILIAYRHGLRVGEVVALRWDQVNLGEGLLHVARLKNGAASTHPLRGPEIRALRRLRRDGEASAYVFTTERGGPLTTSTVRKLVARSSPPAYATPCRGLQAGERGARHAGDSALPRASEHPAYCALHRTGPRPIPQLLERLSEQERGGPAEGTYPSAKPRGLIYNAMSKKRSRPKGKR